MVRAIADNSMRAAQIRLASYLCCLLAIGYRPVGAETAEPLVRLRMEKVHQWRPPFGLERVGQSRAVAVEAPNLLPAGKIIARCMARRPRGRPAGGDSS